MQKEEKISRQEKKLENLEGRIKKLITRLWAGVFVMLLSVVIMFSVVYYDQIAFALGGTYTKSTGDSLLANEWNNLASDFVDKSGDTMTGNLTVPDACTTGGTCLSNMTGNLTVADVCTTGGTCLSGAGGGTIDFYDCTYIDVYSRNCNGVAGCSISGNRVVLDQNGPYVVVGFNHNSPSYGDWFKVCKIRII